MHNLVWRRGIIGVAALAGFSFGLGHAESSAENQWTLSPDNLDNHLVRIEQASGVTPFFSYTGVVQGNPVGGKNQGAAYAYEMLFGVRVNLGRVIGLNGGSLVVSGSQNSGRNLSQTIGNTFNVAQTYVTPTALFYELYYRQQFAGNALEFRIGRMTSTDLFASIPAFGLQVTGGLDGNPTSLFLNSAFTSSPNATWGAAVEVQPSADTYVRSGIYQATNRLGKVAYHGLDFSIRPGDGILLLAETGWTPTLGAEPGNPGKYAAGAYFSTLPFTRFDGSGTEQNTFGFYAMSQQMVWRDPNNPNHSISIWGGVTYSPQTNVAQMPMMVFGGVIWQGLLPRREQDKLLLTAMTGTFSREYAESIESEVVGFATAETVIDVSYIIQLGEHFFVQPDIQYVIRPSGLRSIPNALVLGLQVGCTF